MKIGIAGCSNSTYIWGNPWHYYMGKEFNAHIIEASSPGAGTEMNIEKIKYILETHSDLDLMVVQITEPSRLVVGIESIPGLELTTKLDSTGSGFKDAYYYTFNSARNDDNLEKMFNKRYSVDEFILKHVITSEYNLAYKVFHTLMSIQYLCDTFQKPVIFFSWFVDLYELATRYGYKRIIDNMNVMKSFVLQFIWDNNISVIPNNGHYASDAHQRIFKEYLCDNIRELILSKSPINHELKKRLL